MHRAAIATSLVWLGISVCGFAQLSPLRLTAQWAEYCGESYTAKPSGGSWVFFEGEPLRLHISVRNFDADRAHFLHAERDSTTGSLPQIRVTATRYELPLGESPVGVPSNVVLNLDAQMSRVQLEQVDVETWQPELQLNGGTGIVWSGVLAGAMSPGMYGVVLQLVGADEDKLPVVPAVLRFDIREQTPEAVYEITRRRVCSDMLTGRYSDAEAGANALLKALPTSSEAHLLLGQIAERQEQWNRSIGNITAAEGFASQARRHYEEALGLVETGRDQVFLQYALPHAVDEHTANLRARVDGGR